MSIVPIQLMHPQVPIFVVSFLLLFRTESASDWCTLERRYINVQIRYITNTIQFQKKNHQKKACT